MKLPRRNFLPLAGGAAVVPGVMASGSALAQPVTGPRVKGPRVWLDMDQKELDDAYDQRVYAPNAQQVIDRVQRNSELVRERMTTTRLSYGPTDDAWQSRQRGSARGQMQKLSSVGKFHLVLSQKY
jgi:hypothetical protein